MTCYFKKLTVNGKFSKDKFVSLLDDMLSQAMIKCVHSSAIPSATCIFWKCFYCCNRKVCPWDKKGIYIYGHNKNVMYIGMTGKGKLTNTLCKRLRGRYFGADYNFDYAVMPQFHIASKCKDSLLAGEGVEGFKKDFKDEYDKICKSLGETRIKNARHFAAAGMDGVWFALLPVEEKAGGIEYLERNMIKQAQYYNRGHGISYCINGKRRYLLNVKHRI